jgi:tight adherence protein B
MLGFFLAAFIIFALAFLWAGHYAWTVPQQQTSQILINRMRELRVRTNPRSGGRQDLVLHEERGGFALVGDFFNWVGVLRRLQEIIVQANLKYKAADVFAVSMIIAVVSYLIFLLLGLDNLILRIVFALLLGWIPIFFITKKRAARLAKFEEMLPDAIDLFNRSMKAGHNIHSGLETIAEETTDPVRMEFRKLMEELALGSPLESALHGLGKRVPIIDLKFFITGLILQRQTGANMVAVLENLAVLVRERLNLHAKMRAGTAQQRFSAGLLCGLPLFVGIGFWFLKPEYIKLLYTDETGSKFLTYAIISEIVGIIIIRKLANPKI